MDKQEFEKAYNYAIYLLGLKFRTEGELREKMSARGGSAFGGRFKKYNAQIVEDVIKILKENKYLDDLRYAELYLDNLKKYKSFGYYGIKKKFLEKKLQNDLIERMLNEKLSLDEEIKIAKRLLKKQIIKGVILRPSASEAEESQNKRDPSPSAQDDASRDRQKLALKLRARGFRTEVIRSLLG